MFICCGCKKEMRCEKNGVGADYGYGHVYAGDKYKCHECGREVLHTNGRANHDPEYKQQSEYIDMKGQDNG